jgi:hypothetical protein
VRARIERREAAGVALALAPTAEQRAALIAQLHTREGAHGTMRTQMGGVLGGLANRALRKPAG